MMHIPEIYKTTEKQTRGYLGLLCLSLGKLLFNNKKIMTDYASYVADQFSESCFLICDTPKRHNIMALDQVTEKEAHGRTEKASDDMKRFLEKVTKPYSNIIVKDWTDFTDKSYEANLSILQKAYAQNELFRTICNEGVKEFLGLPQNKTKIQNSSRNIEDVLTQAIPYRLEEFAMLLALPTRFDNPVCEIYPGKDKLQEKLQKGEFDFCKDLITSPTRKFMEVYCK